MKKAIEIVTINDLFVLINKVEDKLRGAAKDRAIEAVYFIMDELQEEINTYRTSRRHLV